MTDAFTLARPLLHAFAPETIHHLGLWALRTDVGSSVRATLPP